MKSIKWTECPKCGRYPGLGKAECPWCGVVFQKVRTRSDPDWSGEVSALERWTGAPASFAELLLGSSRPVNPFVFGGRALVLTGLAVWSLGFLFSPLSANFAGSSFLHGVNLLFHEAGHMIFGLLGEFPGVLGGTLGQVLMPLICVCAFIGSEKEPFGAAVALWWTAENLLDVAPYVNDARAQVLPLLGGVTGRDVPGYHDWNNILGTMGWLTADHRIALLLHGLGALVMVLALLMGGWVLREQFGNLQKD